MRLVSIKTLLLIALAPSAYLAAPVTAFGQDPSDSKPALVKVTHNVHGSGSEQYLCEGEPLNVKVQAIGGMDVFVYVIYHDANRDSFLLFPNPKEKQNVVAAGTSRLIAGKNSGGHFVIRAPFGKERLQVIAAPQRLRDLEQVFAERQPADVLNQWLEWIEAQPEVDTQWSEFETRPRGGEHLQSGPERIQ